MADTLQDLGHFVRGFALFQRRFLDEAGHVAAARPPAGGAAASAASAAPRTTPFPAAGRPPRHTA